ncbi:MAG: PfkB family carbohydrate kinase [Verrucomicrobiales bacterium]
MCNGAEGKRLTNCVDPIQIAEQLVSSERCEVAVIKCGSRGAIVSTAKSTERVPAYETKSVWPIGSGDVFAGAFSVHWAVHRQDPVEAARSASLHAANYCETKQLYPPSGDRSEKVWSGGEPKLVYLAGPFFSMPQIWLINESLTALRSQGFKVFSPLHHVGRGAAKDVYAPDIAGIEQCDLVFACVDGLDAGTLFEIGYAKAKGKPVVAFVQNEKREDLKMLEGSECYLERDFVTAIYRTSWASND